MTARRKPTYAQALALERANRVRAANAARRRAAAETPPPPVEPPCDERCPECGKPPVDNRYGGHAEFCPRRPKESR